MTIGLKGVIVLIQAADWKVVKSWIELARLGGALCHDALSILPAKRETIRQICPKPCDLRCSM